MFNRIQLIAFFIISNVFFLPSCMVNFDITDAYITNKGNVEKAFASVEEGHEYCYPLNTSASYSTEHCDLGHNYGIFTLRDMPNNTLVSRDIYKSDAWFSLDTTAKKRLNLCVTINGDLRDSVAYFALLVDLKYTDEETLNITMDVKPYDGKILSTSKLGELIGVINDSNHHAFDSLLDTYTYDFNSAERSNTPLAAAAKRLDGENIKKLIDNGADPEISLSNNQKPIDLALSSNNDNLADFARSMEQLLKNSEISEKAQGELTEKMQGLIKFTENLDTLYNHWDFTEYSFNKYLTQMAVEKENLVSFQWLLENGIDVNEGAQTGYYLWNNGWARMDDGFLEMLLDAGYDLSPLAHQEYINTIFSRYRTDTTGFIQQMVMNGAQVKDEEVHSFISNDTYSLAMLVAQDGTFKNFKTMADNGMNITAHPADISLLAVASSLGRLDIVEYLLNNGITPDGDNAQTSALMSMDNDVESWDMEHEIQFENFKEIAELLIQNGASVDRKTEYGYTALMASAENNNFGVFEILLDAGADVNAKRSDNKTALMFAASKIDFVNRLIEEGAEVNTVNDGDGTALFLAGGDLDCIKALVVAGADVTHLKQGKNILFYSWGDVERIKYFVEEHNVSINHIDPNSEGNLIYYLLSYQESKELLDVVKYLIDKEIDLTITVKGKTLEEDAESRKRYKIAQMIRDAS
ncbi:MAG: ankyrin repeat domain-containing protein [Reichenbachiella sp.]